MTGLKHILLFCTAITLAAVAGFAQPGGHSGLGRYPAQFDFDTTLIHPGFSFVNSLNDDSYYKECVGPDTLSDGSIICYGQDPSFNRYLFLQKGDSLYLLNKVKAGSFWHLGLLEAEYKNSFMIRHDQGNGCPPTYELFSKKTGKNMFASDLQFDDYLWADHSLYLLYVDNIKNKITLFNFITGNAEYYAIPEDFPKYSSLNFESLESSALTIRYSDYLNFGDELIKHYARTTP